jgi:hypothetical protein
MVIHKVSRCGDGQTNDSAVDFLYLFSFGGEQQWSFLFHQADAEKHQCFIVSVGSCIVIHSS